MIVADRNSPQKHVWRAQIVLLTADGCGTAEIMRHTGVSKTATWRRSERFMTDRVAGMPRDKTRPSRIPPLELQRLRRASSLRPRPIRLVRRRTGRHIAIATIQGISVSLGATHLAQAWFTAALDVHLFKLSNDPQFAAKLRDIVGLYMDPPAHAVVLSIDEKSQIQALDRTQPGLPMKKGRCKAL